MSQHHTIACRPDHCHWGFFDSALTPVATVASGDTVTIDCVSGGRDILPSDPAFETLADHRAILEALPIPVWLRDQNLRLCWANDAFVEAVGASSLENATILGSPLDRSERDLALAARDAAKPVTAKRYAVVQGVRRALDGHPPDGS